MTKAESGCWKLALKPTEEEVQEQSAKLAAAKEIIVNAAVVTSFIRTRWHFKFKRRIKNATKGFSQCKTGFHTRLMSPFTTIGNLKLLLPGWWKFHRIAFQFFYFLFVLVKGPSLYKCLYGLLTKWSSLHKSRGVQKRSLWRTRLSQTKLLINSQEQTGSMSTPVV